MSKINLLNFFKALGEQNRLTIFNHLCRCRTKVNVNEVATCCDVDLSVISRHLATLRKAGVLSSEKKGKEVFYSVDSKAIVEQLRDLADKIEKQSSDCC